MRDNKEELASEVTEEIITNFTERSGIDSVWDSISDNVKEEISRDIKNIILSALSDWEA